ncbi:nucleoside ABC transporter membrane protein [Tissierella praeacuta]|uniref:ABC transporter permease n=1 Tax=Tissierella praeacuta TaxID=43131 RepID=UPI0010487E4B|nr:ABC transporter permease [Tissierella praeacuta]TCU75528.1 nucleoside ABC transporter membrane protein [Tissierella praeacuta]
MLDKLLLLISNTIMYSTPLAFGALGGLMSERSGVINIGLEGMMTIGAATGVSIAYITGNPWIGFLCAGIAGGLIALLHAIASISLRADQSVSGIAINLLGSGASLFLVRIIFGSLNTPPVPKKLPKLFSDSSILGAFSRLNFEVTAVIALLIMLFIWFIFAKTKWGLRISSVGEHPIVADSLGLNVYKIRYICVIISGFLAGLGGASMTLSVLSNFVPTAISGHGFIALTAVIFGKWKPLSVYLSCLFFGLAQAIVIQLGGGAMLSSQIVAMLPYVLTIIVLVLFVGRSVGPKASGVPYEKSK